MHSRSAANPAVQAVLTDDNLLREILKHAPTEKAARVARLVNIRWRKVIRQLVTSLRPSVLLTDSQLATLTGEFTNLTTLDLTGCELITDEAATSVATLKSLAELHFKRCPELTQRAFQALTSLSNLRELEFAVLITVQAAQLQSSLAAHPQLTALSYHGFFEPVNEGVATIASRLGGLESLNLGFVPVSSEEVEALTVLTNLTRLGISWNNALSDGCGASLARMPGLRSLELNRCLLLQAPVGILQLTGLTWLSLECCRSVADNVMAGLSQLKQLRRLSLESCGELTDASLLGFSSLAALTQLEVGRCRLLTDAGAAGLSRLEQLASLTYECSSVSDSGLQSLARVSGLTSLSLSNLQHPPHVSNEALGCLSSLRGLAALEVDVDSHGVEPDVSTWSRLTAVTELHIGVFAFSNNPSLAIKVVAGMPWLRRAERDRMRATVGFYAEQQTQARLLW